MRINDPIAAAGFQRTLLLIESLSRLKKIILRYIPKGEKHSLSGKRKAAVSHFLCHPGACSQVPLVMFNQCSNSNNRQLGGTVSLKISCQGQDPFPSWTHCLDCFNSLPSSALPWLTCPELGWQPESFFNLVSIFSSPLKVI